MNELADALAATAGNLSPAHVTTLAAEYRRHGPHTPAAAAAARHAVPAPHRRHVESLNAAWEHAPDQTGASLALSLEAVGAATARSEQPRFEVVVTGPDSPATPIRLTSEVVEQLIDNAQRRVTIVSFAAYGIPSVIAALDAAVGRGVQVMLILESPERLDGGGGADAYAKYPTWQWPLDRRVPRDAKLHAKAVIVDDHDVLLTSANMTSAAYDKNIELGLLCRGGPVAQQVQAHFDGLIAGGVLIRLHRDL